MSYTVFTRTWWRANPAWPNGLEPHAGKRRTIAKVQTETEARAICAEFAANNRPGRVSRKAEYTEN